MLLRDLSLGDFIKLGWDFLQEGLCYTPSIALRISRKFIGV
jgi:hypothetical protein